MPPPMYATPRWRRHPHRRCRRIRCRRCPYSTRITLPGSAAGWPARSSPASWTTGAASWPASCRCSICRSTIRGRRYRPSAAAPRRRPCPRLPSPYPRRAVHTFRGGAQRLPVPAPLTAALRALSRREGASLFMTLLAAFAVLLPRFGGQEDVLMGIPIAGRQHREIEPLIGFFLNSLVLRSDLSGRPSFRELLRRVRRAALDAFAHQDLPFERLLQELQPERDLSRTPLFQVYFNFQNLPEPPLAMPGVEVEEVLEVEELSKFDLTMYVHDDGGEVRLHLVYNAALFAAERIAEALRQYLALLEQAAAVPDAPTAGFSLVTAAARHLLPDPTQQLDDGWAGAVHQHLAAWARRAPDRLAVTDPGGTWTYADLDRQSNRLANRLLPPR